MDAVKAFNDELSSIYETKPPVSRAKMTILTKKAIKGIKFYKHIVQSMEKFIQKCRPEYKVPGLYVIDSVVRQSRHQFGQEKDVFMPRLCKNIVNTFKHLYKCPPEEKQRIIRVLNLWQKNSVFPPEIVQQLLEMGGASAGIAAAPPGTAEVSKAMHEQPGPSTSESTSSSAKEQPDTDALTSMIVQLLGNANNPQIQKLTGLLSTSQKAQLQALKSQHQEEVVRPPEPPQPEPPQESSVFLPRQDNSQPPFLQSEMEVTHSDRAAPSFNRAILDYDYSDDESPKSQEQNKQHPPPHHSKPGIDLELLAKLPTVDQLKQLSGQISNGDDLPQNSGLGFQNQDSDDRRRRLEAEQEVFSKELQQMSCEMNEGDRPQDDRDRRSSSRRRRSRSKKRSRSRSREHRRHRKRSRSRSHERRRRRSRSHERHRSHQRSSHSAEREKDREREKAGLPPLKEGCISLCSKTLWIGNLSSKITQQEINAEVEQYGPIESINMIPPRGCAYICMEKREDAAKALHRLRYTRMGGKVLKVDWAPGKEVKDEYKEFWSKDDGVNYIPLEKVAARLPALKTQGFIDMESVPEDKRAELESRESSETEEVNQIVAQPAVVPPAGGMMNPRMLPGGVPVMMRPAFPFPGMNPPIGQFGVQQRMPGFQMPPQMPGQPTPVGNVAPAGKMPTPQKQELPSGSKTPTQDEQLMDGAQKAAAVAASIMSSVQPSMHQQRFTMAQPRFTGVGQVPVQIRMVHGMPPQQVMPAQRIGMMPIRMGMPMQFRPGFARVPVGQPMMPFQQPQLGMQRLGQMVQPLPQGPVRLPGGPVGLRNPTFLEQQEPMLDKEGQGNESEKQEDEPGMEGVTPHQPLKVDENMRPNMDRPRFSRPPLVDDRERAMRMGDIPPMGDRMHPMEGRRPPMMDERPPFRFRRSPPPGRFGFGRRHPMDAPDGPRFPGRDRFPERGMERDDRRRDDFRRRDRSPDRRDRDRRDRGMRDRDRKYEDRDRRGHGFGEWGRDRGRFGGRDDFGGRGRGRDGFGGGRRFGDRDHGRFDEEPNPEDLEYQRKRDEVLRQRREKEDDYVPEEVDLSAFGLPSGFGAPSEEKEDSKDEKKNDRRDDRDDDRKRDRDRDRDRRDDYDKDRDRRDRRRDDRDRSRRDRRRSRSRDRDRDRRANERRPGEDGDGKEANDAPSSNKKLKLEDEVSNKDDANVPSEKSVENSESSLPEAGAKLECSANEESHDHISPHLQNTTVDQEINMNELKPETMNHEEPCHDDHDLQEKSYDSASKSESIYPDKQSEMDVFHKNSQENIHVSIPQEPPLHVHKEAGEPLPSHETYDGNQNTDQACNIPNAEPVHDCKLKKENDNFQSAPNIRLDDGVEHVEEEFQCKIMNVDIPGTEIGDSEKLGEKPLKDAAME